MPFQSEIILSPVNSFDRDEILHIWNIEKRWLGNGGLTWKRYVQGTSGNKESREYWAKAIVVPGDGMAPVIVGFAHFLVRLDGWRTLYEIATLPEVRGRGVGRALLTGAVGTPVRLKTDHDNPGSNAFYRRLGFRCVGQVRSRSGARLLNVYERDEPYGR